MFDCSIATCNRTIPVDQLFDHSIDQPELSTGLFGAIGHVRLFDRSIALINLSVGIT